jgi:hypothetical protein
MPKNEFYKVRRFISYLELIVIFYLLIVGTIGSIGSSHLWVFWRPV